MAGSLIKQTVSWIVSHPAQHRIGKGGVAQQMAPAASFTEPPDASIAQVGAVSEVDSLSGRAV